MPTRSRVQTHLKALPWLQVCTTSRQQRNCLISSHTTLWASPNHPFLLCYEAALHKFCSLQKKTCRGLTKRSFES